LVTRVGPFPTATSILVSRRKSARFRRAPLEQLPTSAPAAPELVEMPRFGYFPRVRWRRLPDATPALDLFRALPVRPARAAPCAHTTGRGAARPTPALPDNVRRPGAYRRVREQCWLTRTA